MINKNLSKGKESKFASKNSRGITLIALVVTIVVLIILATVSILAVFGDNGIIARAQTAKDTHEKGKADETNTLDDYASYIGGMTAALCLHIAKISKVLSGWWIPAAW